MKIFALLLCKYRGLPILLQISQAKLPLLLFLFFECLCPFSNHFKNLTPKCTLSVKLPEVNENDSQVCSHAERTHH